MAVTLNYSWTYPTVGADLDTWGGIINQAFIDADADLQAVQTVADAALSRAGGTMTGDIVLAGPPDADLKATTKLYVDTQDALKVAKAGDTMTGPLVAVKAYTVPVVDSPVANVLTIDTNDSNCFKVVLNQNVTGLVLQNPSDGQTINIRFTQDGTGNRTMTWPTSFKWSNGVAPILSTAANAVDFLVGTYFADTGHWYVSLSRSMA